MGNFNHLWYEVLHHGSRFSGLGFGCYTTFQPGVMPTNLCKGTFVENSIGSFLPQNIRNQTQGHCALTARPENQNLDLTGLTFFLFYKWRITKVVLTLQDRVEGLLEYY